MNRTDLAAAAALAAELTDDYSKKAGLDGWEIYLASSRSMSLEAKDGRIDAAARSNETGMSVRAIKQSDKGAMVGLAYTFDLAEEALARTASQAAELAELAQPEPALNLAPPPESLPEMETVDPTLDEIPEQVKIDLALQLEKTALAHDPRVFKVRQAAFEESHTAGFIKNSLGLDVSRSRTMCQTAIMVLAREGEENQVAYDFSFSPFFDQLETEAAAIRAAAEAVGQLGAKRAKSGSFPVVLDNTTAASLLSVLAPAFLAEQVQKGKSLLAGKVGKEIFSPTITIIDDGLRPGGAGSRPFDDEGTPQQRTTLMDAGRLTGYLYDRLSAKRDQTAPTGNGGRGVKSQPGCGVTNLFIQPDQSDKDGFIGQIEDGFLITDLMGLHTADPISGDFSLGASGRWIEQGRVAFPVQGAAVSGNLVDLFNRITRVGADIRFMGKIGAPSLLLDHLDVAG